jgi:RNA 2',3'-cyclic 3'-phosphodiesterase
MSVIRAFIAIDLPPDVSRQLDQVSKQLKEHLQNVPIRWASAENIHLTIKFLGEVSLANLTMLKEVLEAEVNGHRPFEVSVGGLGAFPNLRMPRVVWIGIEAPSDLASLQRGVEGAMSRIGYAREDRPFSPHLTLGRVSRNASSRESHIIGEVLEATKIGYLGLIPVSKVCLYRSDLKPSGATYTRIFQASLNKQSPKK